MKNVFFVLIILCALNSKAQTDTVNKVKTHLGAIPIIPIVVNANGDSAYSVSWRINSITSDTSVQPIVFIYVHDKKGAILSIIETKLSQSVSRKFFGSFSFVDSFILGNIPRFKKK